MNRVVGLDLSLTATGIAYSNGSTGLVKPLSRGDARLAEIRGEVRTAVVAADLVVIEDAVVRSSAAVAIGMVHGAVRVMLQTGPPYVLIPPATLKKFATGKGNADKTAMAVALLKRAGLELPTSDEVDAWWLRAAGLQLLGEPVVTLPAAQVAALDKIRIGES